MRLLKLQRLGLLHLRQRAHGGEHGGRQLAVDLDQRDRIAAGRLAADVEVAMLMPARPASRRTGR